MKRALFILTLLILAVACGKDEDETTLTPVACFTFSGPGATIYVGDPVEFNNCSTDAESFNWDFGDGSTSTEKNPTHAFEESKEYEVILVARGNGDNPKTDTTMLPITVWKAVK